LLGRGEVQAETTTPEGKGSSASVTYEDKGQPTRRADEPMPLGREPKDPTPAAPAARARSRARSRAPDAGDAGPAREKRDQLVRAELRPRGGRPQAKDADGLIRAARAALDIDETNVEAMVMLAHGNYLKGYDDKAEAVPEPGAKQRAGDAHPLLWMLLGLVYDRTDREDQALAAYERATQLKPDYLAALTNRGAIYLERKRYADAITVFEQVVQLHASRAARTRTSARRIAAARPSGAGQKVQRDQLLKRAESELRRRWSRSPLRAGVFQPGHLVPRRRSLPGDGAAGAAAAGAEVPRRLQASRRTDGVPQPTTTWPRRRRASSASRSSSSGRSRKRPQATARGGMRTLVP
jgi:tetratricopeptide (TPR) repeat protein